MKQEKSITKNALSNIGYIVKTAWKVEKSVIYFCVLLIITAVLINLLQLFFVPFLLENITIQPFWKIIIYVTTFSVSWMLLDAFQTYINANVIFGRIELRSFFTFKIHGKVATTSLPNLENKDFLDQLDRASDCVSSNEGAVSDIWNVFTQIGQSVIGLCIYILLLAKVDFWLIVITVLASFLGYIVKVKTLQWVYDNKNREADLSRRIGYISGIPQKLEYAKDLRLYNMRHWLSNIRKEDFTNYKSYLREKMGRFFTTDLIKLLLTVLKNAFIYVYIINHVLNNQLSIAFFVLMLGTATGMDVWIDGLFSSLAKVNEYSIQISYIRDFLSFKEVFLFEEGKSVPASDGWELELKDISYAYPSSQKKCFTDFSLKIKAGEKVAIVGANGAGKTTLVKLISGLLEPDEGNVLLNGCDIREYNKHEYYELFSCVFQEYSLLAGTLASNIAQTNEDIDYEKVKVCADTAGIHGKIESLPQKYETNIVKEVYDDAIELSGGETQRLLLARCMYKNGPIMILDEPTAALDPIAEAAMYRRYNEISEGKTSIYISHRLASTKFCDRIVLIEDGKIAEEGSHESLMQRKGKYFELFCTQSQYYKAVSTEL